MPRLYDADGNLDESWFVFYSYRNPKSDKMQRFRVYDGFKALKTAGERRHHANNLIQQIKSRIKKGWTPFEDEEVIYDDHIQYKNVTNLYGKQRKSNITVRFYLSEFLREMKVKVRKKTFESYQSKIRLFANWLDMKGKGGNDISTIDSDVILQFFDYLIHERQLQGRTVDKYGQNLRQFFKSLLDKKKIYVNPMPEELPKAANTVDYSAKPIRRDDIEKLKEVIKKHDPQLWLFIEFEFYTFIRPRIELRYMQLQWIDFSNGTITIPKSIYYDGKHLPIAKNGKAETIVIPRQFLNTLIHDHQLRQYHKSLFLFGRNRCPGEHPYGNNTLANRFNNYRDALGMSKDYKLYSWKHTGGVMASNSGMPVKDIQLQMRHHSLEVTDQYLKKMKGVDSDHLKNQFPTL